MASALEGSMLKTKNGRFWGGDAFLRPILHWQCQLGTIPYTVQYYAVITVLYGFPKL